MEVLPLLSWWLDSNCEVVSCRVCVAIYGEEVHGGDRRFRVRRNTRDLGFPFTVVRNWLERTLFLRFWLGFYFLQVAMDSGVVVRRWCAKGFWWRYWAVVSAFD
ncbi:hypothetical protein V8G54_006458 [Vigna mungo]|uniref:Uncharacterized protein n=1 Tax=Vigna mungo TaxID=3915 RepID=A0AAQ3NZ16_VIGMU